VTPSGERVTWHSVLEEVNSGLRTRYRWQRQLSGGEQNGAHLVTDGGRQAVLKWQPVQWKAQRLLQVFPAVTYAANGGWPVARWLEAGPLTGGGAFLLQEYVAGTPMSGLTSSAVSAVVAANSRQSGLGFPDAADDSAQLEAVLRGDCAWKSNVAGFTAAGAELVQRGDDVAAWAASAPIPVSDVVHGDYSSSNILLDAGSGTACFVDCETVGRGSRVRDLADLYRQSFVYPDASTSGRSLLRAAATAIAGPLVFAKCVVAVTYNNLAWWAERKTAAEFDQACGRLRQLFDDVRYGAS
jgi:aminoglycoside phosphotransferase (APT) family kinase protein